MGKLVALMVVVASLAAGRAARAEEPPLVNLLTSAPSTIAVSSTVDNATIRPEHIADGKLDTAWNSATGQIIGAWVEVRVPAGARIKQIKLTPGFAAVDRRLGDLFTKNARIRALRLSHAGRPIKDVILDPTRRTLQTIDVDLPGGDLRLEVLAAEPGSKKAWREACISELEVWGTLPGGAAAPTKRTRPSVRLRSLDALPVLSKADCRVIVLTSDRKISGARITVDEQVALSQAVTICRFDRQVAGSLDVTVDLAAVDRRTRTVLGALVTETIQRGEEPEHEFTRGMGPTEHTDRVELRSVPLTRTETGLLVDVITDHGSWFDGGGATATTLYRVSASGLDAIAQWTSSRDKGMEGGSSSECELVAPTVGSKLPARLELACRSTDEDWHNEDEDKRGMNEQERTEYLRWDGTRYTAP